MVTYDRIPTGYTFCRAHVRALADPFDSQCGTSGLMNESFVAHRLAGRDWTGSLFCRDSGTARTKERDRIAHGTVRDRSRAFCPTLCEEFSYAHNEQEMSLIV